MMMHPAILMLIAGIAVPFAPVAIRKILLVLVPAGVLFVAYNLQYEQTASFTFINNMELIYLQVDRLSWIFVFIISVIALSASIYGLQIETRTEIAAQFLYLAGSFGVLLAGDWITLIFFWELMAVSSVFLVWSNRDEKAKNAGFRYLMVHFFGGNLLLAGIFLKVSQGQYLVSSLTDQMDLAAILIFLGIAVNAAIYPLHAWIPDAYPQGTLSGSVFMSFLTTKVAIYALVRVFPGLEILIWLGCVMALVAVAYAMIANDIRLIFSYHIVSQLGYMVAAAGIGTELALNGSVAHAFSNVLYKSLLFMGSGAIIYATGRSKLTELGGLFRRTPYLTALFLVGSLAISGFPYLNGFTTKAVVLSAASLAKYPSVELMLYLASIGTLISTCLKFIFFAFMGEPKEEYDLKPVPVNMYIAMGINAGLCFIYGIFPALLYDRLPFDINYMPYTFDHIISTLQILLAATLTFALVMETVKPKQAFLLDVDWFYRVPLVKATYAVSRASSHLQDKMGEHWRWNLQRTYPFFANPLRRLIVNDRREYCPLEFDEDYYRFPIGTAVTIGLVVFLGSFIYIVL